MEGTQAGGRTRGGRVVHRARRGGQREKGHGAYCLVYSNLSCQKAAAFSSCTVDIFISLSTVPSWSVKLHGDQNHNQKRGLSLSQCTDATFCQRAKEYPKIEKIVKGHRWETKQSDKGDPGISRRVHLLGQRLSRATHLLQIKQVPEVMGVYLRPLKEILLSPWHYLKTAGSDPYPHGSHSPILMKIVMALFLVRVAPSGSFPNIKHSKLRLWVISPGAGGCPGSVSLLCCGSCYSFYNSQ